MLQLGKRQAIPLFQLLARQLPGDPYVLQIGAMDGVYQDPIHEVIRERDLAALLVEPEPAAMEKLRQNYLWSRRARPCWGAVIETDLPYQHVKLWYVPEETIQRRRLPEWLRGCSSLHRDRGELFRFGRHLKFVLVPGFPVEEILGQCFATPDIVAIDAEGSDWLILNRYPIATHRPGLVLIEHKHLTGDEINLADEKMKSCGYAVARDDSNTVYSTVNL
jgi:hypothetical protein